jgi:HPt (histidine-containing phosphotransfer) domain-containing protein
MRSIDSINLQTDEPVFAPAVLEALFGEAPGVIASVLDTFCASMDQQRCLLQAAVAAGNTAPQQEIAHRMKGAARMSGALAMAQAAERLELAARSATAGGQNGCGTAAAALDQQWARLAGDASFQRARYGG